MARYPSFEDYRKRLESFTSQFPITGISSTLFAEAGFYSIAVQDYTRCFYCGVGLRGWDNTDDPWIQHAKFSSSCQFLIEKKGIEFIRSYQPGNSAGFRSTETRTTNEKTERPSENDSATTIRKLNDNEIRLHVKMRMEYPKTRMLLENCSELGISQALLEKALETRLDLQNDDFESFEDWIEAAKNLSNQP
ncbi:DgyrCDS3635 [Dimorphilus gyrociliatus]|uniref:DgyrCDS3635 n=1 Tax=Dimorphilus gyrociliatus TaxID=2664684 RepID=A0A7I8VEY9_9ANNE|nr:DgyrCDS3635 [Dimorphilus gyrociliatus]